MEMLLCDAYELNNNVCPDVPHIKFYVLWEKIDNEVHEIMDDDMVLCVLNGRSTQGYKSSMDMQPYQDSNILF